MTNNFNNVNPVLYLKGVLNTIYSYLLRIQFPEVMFLRLSGNFQNLEFNVKYQIQTKPQQPRLRLPCVAIGATTSPRGDRFSHHDYGLARPSLSLLALSM